MAFDPISDCEFDALMQLFEPLVPPIALAVSGGGDSMALAALLARWIKRQAHAPTVSNDLIAFHIDHGLRPESGREAILTRDRLSDLGLRTRLLKWHNKGVTRGIQAQARAARYKLLTAAAQQEGCLHLFVAHHAGDQAETAAMRARRSTGRTMISPGLAAMHTRRLQFDIELLRPLLHIDKGRLIATCKALGVAWIEDPSNRDHRFERVRVREELALDQEWQQRLLAQSQRISEQQALHRQQALRLLARALEVAPNGLLSIDCGEFLQADPTVQAAALAACLERTAPNQSLARGRGSPRSEQLQLAISKSFIGRKSSSIGRCVLKPVKGGVEVHHDPRSPNVVPLAFYRFAGF